MNTIADISKVENEKVNILGAEKPFKELSDVKLPFASIKQIYLPCCTNVANMELRDAEFVRSHAKPLDVNFLKSKIGLDTQDEIFEWILNNSNYIRVVIADPGKFIKKGSKDSRFNVSYGFNCLEFRLIWNSCLSRFETVHRHGKVDRDIDFLNHVKRLCDLGECLFIPLSFDK